MIFSINNKGRSDLIKFCFSALILLTIYAFSLMTINDIGLSDTFLFLLYQIFAILIPGITIVTLLQIRETNALVRFGYYYAFGYAGNIVIYFPIMLSGLKDHAAVIVAAYSLICLVSLFFLRKNDKFSISREKIDFNKKDLLFLIIISVVFFALQFITYGFQNSVSASGDHMYHGDLMYWEGNTVALSESFPPANIRMAGESYGYHYFSSLQLALINLVTNIRISFLCGAFSMIQANFILILSSYIIIKRITKKDSSMRLGLISLLFVSGIQKITGITLFSHLVYMPFGFDYGMAFMYLIINFLIIQHEKIKEKAPLPENIKLMLISVFLFFICCGLKAPCACIALVFSGFLALFWFFKEKKYILGAIYPVAMAVVLLLMYVYFFTGYGGSGQGAASSTVISLTGTVSRSPINDLLLQLLSKAGITSMIPVYIIDYAGIFLSDALIYIVLAIGGIIYYIKSKKMSPIIISLILTALAGKIMFIVIQHYGLSQMYYSMASAPMLLFIGISYFDEKPEKFKTFAKSIIALSLALSVGLFARKAYQFYRTSSLNIKNYHDPNDEELFYSKDSKIDCIFISQKDYEALNWVRENTDKSSVIASNQIVNNQKLNCGVAVFTERQAYIDVFTDNPSAEAIRRREILEKISGNDKAAYEQLFSDEKVDYLIIIKRVTDEFKPESYMNLVFENESAYIFHGTK